MLRQKQKCFCVTSGSDHTISKYLSWYLDHLRICFSFSSWIYWKDIHTDRDRKRQRNSESRCRLQISLTSPSTQTLSPLSSEDFSLKFSCLKEFLWKTCHSSSWTPPSKEISWTKDDWFLQLKYLRRSAHVLSTGVQTDVSSPLSYVSWECIYSRHPFLPFCPSAPHISLKVKVIYKSVIYYLGSLIFFIVICYFSKVTYSTHFFLPNEEDI